MSKKKKKQKPSERQLQIYAEAEKRKLEIAEAKRKKEHNSIVITFSLAIIIFAVAFGLMVTCIAKMRNYETNYEKVEGEVVEIKKRTTASGYSKKYYHLVVEYRFNNENFEFVDTVGYRYIPESYIGTLVELYVNPQNPEKVVKTDVADDLSIFSVVVSIFGLFLFIAAMVMYLQREMKFSVYDRILYIWLPLMLVYFISSLLYLIGLPGESFVNMLTKIDGALGCAVVSLIVLAVIIFDSLISYASKNKKKVK